MKVRKINRRRFSCNNAWNVDTVAFMGFAASHRWREVEDFFPPDDDAEMTTEQTSASLPRPNYAWCLHGSCGHHPDEVLMIKEQHLGLGAAERVARDLDLSLQDAELVLSMSRNIAHKTSSMEEANRAELAWRRIVFNSPSKKTPELVKLEGEIQRPDPELAEAMRKEAKKTEAKNKAKARAKVARQRRATQKQQEKPKYTLLFRHRDRSIDEIAYAKTQTDVHRILAAKDRDTNVFSVLIWPLDDFTKTLIRP